MTPEKTLKVIQTVLMILTSVCCLTALFTNKANSIKLMVLGVVCYGLAWVAHLFMKGARR